MSTYAEDIKDVLVASGVGVFAAETGWAIFVAKEPDEPDTTITVYDVGGFTPNPKWLLDYPTFQIKVKGARGGYPEAYAKARAARDSVLGAGPFDSAGGNHWRGIIGIGDLVHIGFDAKNRPMFTANFTSFVEPAATPESHREPIT